MFIGLKGVRVLNTLRGGCEAGDGKGDGNAQ